MTADAAGLNEFYDYTYRLLLDVVRKRDDAKLRRVDIRIRSTRFSALSQQRQDTLLEMLGQANTLHGVMS